MGEGEGKGEWGEGVTEGSGQEYRTQAEGARKGKGQAREQIIDTGEGKGKRSGIGEGERIKGVVRRTRQEKRAREVGIWRAKWRKEGNGKGKGE